MNSGDTDPWSGDEVPVASGLGEIVWETPSSAAEGIGTETVPGADQTPRRRLVIPAIAIAAVGILLVAVFAWPDQSESTADEPASSTPAVPTTLDILPPATASTTTPPTTTQPPGDTAVADAGAFDEIDAVTEELPTVLADAELATEVVLVTSDGELVTISLPDGDVTERVDLGLSRTNRFQLGSNLLVVSPDASMYAIEGELIVVPSGGPALSVDRAEFDIDGDTGATQLIPFGWVAGLNGDFVFVVISSNASGREAEWLVTRSGEVSPAPAQRSGSFARLIYAIGTRFIDDAGGVYRVDPNGDSSRISSGDALAISSTRLLLRECNANRVCNAVLRDYQGEQVRVVDLPPSFQPRFLAASLSPDDRAVALAGANVAGERTILDLDSGEILLFAGQGGQVLSPTWTADGAGIFALGSAAGIRFLDRVSGEEFSLAAGLGQIRAIATRSPAG